MPTETKRVKVTHTWAAAKRNPSGKGFVIGKDNIVEIQDTFQDPNTKEPTNNLIQDALDIIADPKNNGKLTCTIKIGNRVSAPNIEVYHGAILLGGISTASPEGTQLLEELQRNGGVMTMEGTITPEKISTTDTHVPISQFKTDNKLAIVIKGTVRTEDNLDLPDTSTNATGGSLLMIIDTETGQEAIPLRYARTEEIEGLKPSIDKLLSSLAGTTTPAAFASTAASALSNYFQVADLQATSGQYEGALIEEAKRLVDENQTGVFFFRIKEGAKGNTKSIGVISIQSDGTFQTRFTSNSVASISKFLEVALNNPTIGSVPTSANKAGFKKDLVWDNEKGSIPYGDYLRMIGSTNLAAYRIYEGHDKNKPKDIFRAGHKISFEFTSTNPEATKEIPKASTPIVTKVDAKELAEIREMLTKRINKEILAKMDKKEITVVKC